MATMKCPRCGSENIMPNLRIRDRYDAPIGQDIAVEIESNPNALIFKGAHREALRATVCGECETSVFLLRIQRNYGKPILKERTLRFY